jgi:hypothetical protein
MVAEGLPDESDRRKLVELLARLRAGVSASQG